MTAQLHEPAGYQLDDWDLDVPVYELPAAHRNVSGMNRHVRR